ncbi:nitrous oxide reductase family maturation protein NosD [Sneathiella sp.]|uniref:nitrous oxide reductase family maturation protein NosD n=1 Tax=Sneathiella sp. TaxID=1964365 RepID=UPI0026168D89|nr:nitrous oxide reductase family maturation protein NosD [Sneathiella sp.]MDF2368943.1 nitrous oxide reductase family maturation protein NosD [Sneathiella sp.]
MRLQRNILWQIWGAVAVVATASLPLPYAEAREVDVSENLQQAIEAAAPGDTLILAAGTYDGSLVITKPLTILGNGNAKITGTSSGSVIHVKAPDARLEGLIVTGSGLSLETQDSGIFLDQEATGAIISNNVVTDNLIGIYVSGAENAHVIGNQISGRQDLRMNERGNGIQIWNAPGAIIENNDIRYGRDGIFVTTSERNIFKGNSMRDLRFAIHYMYTNNSEVIGNRSYGNHIGYAIMSSSDLVVEDNLSEQDRDRGILFNYAVRVAVTRNIVRGGTEKCIFIYNSHDNYFEENLLSDCTIGIHFTAGSEKNTLTRNAFVNNRNQVKYVGTRWLEWSRDGVGNYWSDQVAMDLDRNGVADSIYRPNDLTDRIIWQYPSARLLLNSPAVQILKYAQSNFPALHPGGVVDSAPLMAIPKNLTDGSKS